LPYVSFMITQQIIYLDNNATTVCAPEVVDEMLPYFAEQYGNASSTHLAGRQAFRSVEKAREKIAALLNVQPSELFFNSGATEGNNWLLLAFAQMESHTRRRIVVSAIEHKSVLDAALRLRRFAFDVHLLPVTPAGVVDLAQAAAIITPDTALVAVQYANNETGVVQPIAELIEMTHAVGAFFHCDAVQGLGKAQLDFSTLMVDSAVFSAHKIHAPKGVGALYIRGGARSWNFDFPIKGGGQEHSIRPGTYNVPGIVGFGKAAELIQESLLESIQHMNNLRGTLEDRLKQIIPHCHIHGKGAIRLPNTTNFVLNGVSADILMPNIPLCCVSTGSACNSGTISPSYVLAAMGCQVKENRESIRISLSRYTLHAEIDNFIVALSDAYSNLLRM
jgi:cysteine desulfurase